MYKNSTKKIGRPLGYIYKFLLIMRLTTVLLIATMLQVSAEVYAQKITLNEKKQSMEQVLAKIRSQSGYDFLIYSNLFKELKPVTVKVFKVSLEDALDACFEDQSITYVIREQTIVLQLKEKSLLENVQQYFSLISVYGRVINLKGEPLAGATIRQKRGNRSVYTNARGEFLFPRVEEKSALVISFIGYEDLEVQAVKNLGVVQLKLAEKKLEEVLISTGMFSRRKESFTGATATFSGDQLRNIGGTNILQSLKSLDPSFLMLDNNLMGSNPNQLPQIELRGRTSINTSAGSSSAGLGDEFVNNPNQPLFILDGMETTLRQIIDLDVNRVASITLLKDAASTSLYGSKAANGVVVVETIRPKPGELLISYSAAGIMETPDLSSYNMMNAEELLEFQRLSEMYKPAQYASGFSNENLYNQRLKEVKKGVNSYWLSTPLRNAFNVGHSLNISGGDEKFTYGIGGNYRDYKGVMIGSDHNTWGGNISLNYRKKNINVVNLLNINGATNNNSPYGNFSDYVKLSPYYRKVDENGQLNTNRYLEEYELLESGSSFPSSFTVRNPLYNASLNSRDRSLSTTMSNNLNLLWDVAASLRVSAGIQLNKTTTENQLYIPALNTVFDDKPVLEKGSYSVTNINRFGYQGFLGLTYNKVIREAHSLNWNIRGSIQENEISSLGTNMIGFPAGVAPVPGFAHSYLPDTKPLGAKSTARNMSILASFNYSYKGKYNLDATYNLDGSNSFGNEKLFSPFWSVGAGWNIDRESFFNKSDLIDQLRLRANIGINGNQGFGQFLSSSTYVFDGNTGSFGQSLLMKELGNSQLDWQKTTQASIGLDASLFNRRLVLTLNAYRKLTNPLVVGISLPSSTGLSSFYDNVGSLKSKGLELNLQVSPINKPESNLIWTIGLTGSLLSNKYGGLSALMKNFNRQAQESNSLLRYYDGYSPDDIWSVRSLGIDPANGAEVFLRKNGEYTTQYSSNDIVKVGTSRPLSEGVVSSNLSYQGFRLGLYLRYRIGASFMNSALFEKVENISFSELQNNQDKRALYKRWKQPGDVASFRSISSTAVTQMSSRFIQKENSIIGESLSISYLFSNKLMPWMDKMRLKNLRLTAVVNDIFRWSNIQLERGTSYPFARTATVNINASF